jgi:heme/copper-type cytochrome/quinol oxidase subunit 2
VDIERVRRLREHYEAMLDDAEAARATYHQALRELYRSGVPLRDLAEQLGMSHQRVHQIVGETTQPAKKRDRRVTGAIVAVMLGAMVLLGAVLWPEGPSDETQRRSFVTIDVLTRGRLWRFDYPRYGVSVSDRSPEIFLPAGTQVRFALQSADVIHSMWIPRLEGKQDIVPGQTNRFVLHSGAPDTYWGTDAEYAGIKNKLPTFEIRVVPLSEFEEWITEVRSTGSV